MMDIENIRRDYELGALHRHQLSDDPYRQFDTWLQHAVNSDLCDPTAMTLATVDETGQPSQRIVLLKHVDHNGLVFFTHYHSRKSQNISFQPRVSLHFPWHGMERQVSIKGCAVRLSQADTQAYFSKRPRESQLAAWASHQSQPLPSRAVLQQQFHRVQEQFKQGEVPLPEFWGGYCVKPEWFEFWQGGRDRLHDRFEYVKSGDRWRISRLSP